MPTSPRGRTSKKGPKKTAGIWNPSKILVACWLFNDGILIYNGLRNNPQITAEYNYHGALGRQTLVKVWRSHPRSHASPVPGFNNDNDNNHHHQMGVSLNGGTQQPWVFLLKMIILGCEMGVPPFKETPIYHILLLLLQLVLLAFALEMWNGRTSAKVGTEDLPGTLLCPLRLRKDTVVKNLLVKTFAGGDICVLGKR